MPPHTVSPGTRVAGFGKRIEMHFSRTPKGNQGDTAISGIDAIMPMANKI